jgi:hypothetical protein
VRLSQTFPVFIFFFILTLLRTTDWVFNVPQFWFALFFSCGYTGVYEFGGRKSEIKCHSPQIRKGYTLSIFLDTIDVNMVTWIK